MCVVCDLKRMQQGAEPASSALPGSAGWLAGQARPAIGPRLAMPEGSGVKAKNMSFKKAT